MAYTPGVARICLAIRDDRQRAFSLTMKQKSVAVVLGLGDIGPEAALPVMEGKARLFKEFADVDAFPLCLATKRVDKIVETVKLIAPAFGGINREDIAAPRCFEIEERLRKDLKRLRVVVTGVGAAGTATIKILQSSGVRDIIGVDEHGTIHRGRAKGMDFMKQWVGSTTNPRRINGRSDYPNQIDNVLSFPGFFRGLVDSRARTVNDEMKLAAARALAACIGRSELGEEYIIPSVFNQAVAPAVAEGVARAAHETGVGHPRRRMNVAGVP